MAVEYEQCLGQALFIENICMAQALLRFGSGINIRARSTLRREAAFVCGAYFYSGRETASRIGSSLCNHYCHCSTEAYIAHGTIRERMEVAELNVNTLIHLFLFFLIARN